MNELFKELGRLHTTPMGEERIRKNLNLETEDVVAWCREKILSRDAEIARQGKNWYVTVGEGVLTVNASSLTIITAHRHRG